DKDTIIQHTDHDASSSRLSAVQTGYLTDPFAHLLHPTAPPTRRLPLINRGTYTRTSSIDTLVTAFLSHEPARKKQILSLGAGSDTRFFRLRSSPEFSHLPTAPSQLAYHEFDFLPVASTKRTLILTHPPLTTILYGPGETTAPAPPEPESNIVLQAEGYTLHSLDLRTIPAGTWTPPGVDPTLPTLVISECCLIYLPPQAADTILRTLTTTFPSVGIVLYEPISNNSAFGKVMVSNLASRGIELKTLSRYSTLDAQRERLRMLGFEGGRQAQSILECWRKWVPVEEKDRVGGLEMLDEVEEWELLGTHYCVAWGWKGG
ncbi:leucine carboxyl methyltransferase, partial [Ascobolus immersus RN42]